jgi:rod shape-determining protein MreD
MANVLYTSREQIEVYRFSWVATILIPAAAFLLQWSLPVRMPFFAVFDLPLLLTIFFAVARRNQVSGMMTGAVLGIIQDSLTHQPIGLYGIAKTVVGYASSSLGVRLDVENPGSRLLMTFGFFTVARGLVDLPMEWRWGHALGAALANSLLAVVLFTILDRFKARS